MRSAKQEEDEVAYGSPWDARKWSFPASLLVIVGISAALYYTMGGCETRPPAPQGGDDPATRALKALQALSDQNLLELSLQIGYFHASQGRLPRSPEEVRDKVRVPGWPPAPMATSSARAIAYRTTGDRTYEFALPGSDGKPGTKDDIVIPQDVPAEAPPSMDPDAFRNWWVMKQLARLHETTQP